MSNRANTLWAVVLVCACGLSAAADVAIETVVIGDPGNVADTHGIGYGAVDYVYNIAKYEVTAGQYAEFLNAVAATDTYGLYNTNMESHNYGCKIYRKGSPGSYTYWVASDWADRPVNYVSWGDCARFSNWLHNGQPTGPQDLTTTEDGSYFLNGATNDSDLRAVAREPDATWGIPSENEWYKAAYYDSAAEAYYNFSTGGNAVPSNDLIDPDPGYNATFLQSGYTIGSPYWRTEAGAHENSGSPYGTFDQGGNVSEWNDAEVWGLKQGYRGGSWRSASGRLFASDRGWDLPSYEFYEIGFRVSEIPEPNTLLLLGLGVLALFNGRKSVLDYVG